MDESLESIWQLFWTLNYDQLKVVLFLLQCLILPWIDSSSMNFKFVMNWKYLIAISASTWIYHEFGVWLICCLEPWIFHEFKVHTCISFKCYGAWICRGLKVHCQTLNLSWIGVFRAGASYDEFIMNW